MFVKRFSVIFALLVMCFASSGCSTNNFFKSWLPSSSPSTLEVEMANLPHPFIVAYGLNSASSMLLFKPTDSNADKLANISLVLAEPGFVAMINLDFCKDGMNTKLENLFKREGFHLVGTHSYKFDEDKFIFKMFFIKNGMDGKVIF